MTRRARRGLATWITNSVTPLFVLDERRVVLVFNRGCEELTGWGAADVIGQPCHPVSEADPDKVEALTGVLSPPQHVLEGTPDVLSVHIRRRDGTDVQRKIQFVPLIDAGHENPLRVLGILLPPDTVQTAPLTSRRFELARLTAELHQKYRIDRLVAKSAMMTRVAAQIELARSGAPSVHLVGEPGTGKEHIARMIHYGGPLKSQRFVPIRCATGSHFELNRTLRRMFEETEEGTQPGTVYLDRVERLPRDLQARIVEQGTRTGLRLMSSSLAGLSRLSEEEFDPRLACLLTSLVIEIPPLRDRGDDLPLLAQQILEELNRDRQPQREGFSPAVERAFLQYRWPGNMDELASVVQEAARRGSGPKIDVADLPFQFSAGMDAQSVGPPAERIDLDTFLARVEREQIERALDTARGNKTAAAELLGLPRARLYRRMTQLGLADSEERPSVP